MRKVAIEVGVSTNAVSKVLNGSRSNTRVSDATRDKILEVAKRMNYRPNELARSFQRRRTNLLGFFLYFEFLSSRNAFLAELMGGVEEECSRAGYDLALRAVRESLSPNELAGRLGDQRVDGLIYFAPRLNGVARELISEEVPLIQVVDPFPGAPTVCVDDRTGGRLMAEHLFEKGHRRVIYRDWFAPPRSAAVRRAGFTEAALRLGMDVVNGKAMTNDHQGELLDYEFELVKSREATAFAVWGDASASATCDGLVSAGLRVPDDAAVIGFNGHSYEITPRWQLTTVVAPWREVGVRAVRNLLRLVNGSDVPQMDVLNVSLRPGSTT